MNKINLLFVEDNLVDQLSFKRFVEYEKLSYQYDCSSSLAEAINMLLQHDYQLILADITLGDGSAFELFKYISDFTPVIFITATGCEETAIKAIKFGVADYIVKEIDGSHLKKLPSCIEGVLKRQQALYSHIEQLIAEHKKHLSEPLETHKQENEFESLEALAFKTHICIVITDNKANILRVNNPFYEITGYSPVDVIGKNMKILKSGKQDAKFYQEFWQQLTKLGKFEGEVWNRRKDKSIYLQWLTVTAIYNENHDITNYVAIMSDVTEKYKIEQQIRKLAFYDSLTSLANRRLLIDRIQHEMAFAKRHNLYGSLIFLDIDKFKTLNDNFGHHTGDQLLIQVSRRLTSILREEDTAARLGGDEFVVLIHAIEENAKKAEHNAEVVAEKIRKSLDEPYLLKNKEFFFSSSIGVVLYPNGAVYADEILQQADKAMYASKNRGGNVVSFFQHGLEAEKHLYILLVEDSVTDTLLTIYALKEFELHTGIQVHVKTIANGVDAIIYFEQPENKPDLILLDLDLPKANGFQVMDWLKTHETAKNIPVVIFTMSQDDDVIDKCVKLNAKGFIEKPMTVDKLKIALNNIGIKIK